MHHNKCQEKRPERVCDDPKVNPFAAKREEERLSMYHFLSDQVSILLQIEAI